ncbi:hypothetical protein [Tepidibacter mesophilus]|nr:hypothetical protein [Tepidibacter mesophilus]
MLACINYIHEKLSWIMTKSSAFVHIDKVTQNYVSISKYKI